MGAVLETPRLVLRELTAEDFGALYDTLADSDVRRHYPYTFDERRVRGWIGKNIERYRDFGFGLWAVVLKATGSMIGDCGITMQCINGRIKPEIGYHLQRDWQGRGYAREAARACRDWAFEHTPFGTLYSYMKADNAPSIGVARSCGMQLVEEYTDDENERSVVYAVTRSEWAAEKGCIRR